LTINFIDFIIRGHLSTRLNCGNRLLLKFKISSFLHFWNYQLWYWYVYLIKFILGLHNYWYTSLVLIHWSIMVISHRWSTLVLNCHTLCLAGLLYGWLFSLLLFKSWVHDWKSLRWLGLDLFLNFLICFRAESFIVSLLIFQTCVPLISFVSFQ